MKNSAEQYIETIFRDRDETRKKVRPGQGFKRFNSSQKSLHELTLIDLCNFARNFNNMRRA